MKKILTLYFVLFFYIAKSFAIYTHHKIETQKYVDAAQQFRAVVKIHVLDDKNQIKAMGSGAWVQDLSTGLKFILTASHVLRDGARYQVVTPEGKFKIRRIQHFDDFILNAYLKDFAITVQDARTGQRMFGIRVSQEPDIQEALRSYGLDLAVAFIDEDLSVQPYILPTSVDLMIRSPLYWAVGYGESGSGESMGMFTSFIRYGGGKKAFNPIPKPHYYLNFTHILSGKKKVFTLLGSIFQEEIHAQLEGQVGPGDSGGPLLQQGTHGVWVVRGVICSSLPRIHTHAFQQDESFWARLIKKMGKIAESRTPFSYLFWQEGNVYGSEAHYIDLTSPLVQEWIQSLKR